MRLHNLPVLVKLCRARFEAIDGSLDMCLSGDVWQHLADVVGSTGEGYRLTLSASGFGLSLTGPDGLCSNLSSTCLTYVWAFAAIRRALVRYQRVLSLIGSFTLRGIPAKERQRILEVFPDSNWEKSVDAITPGTSALVSRAIEKDLNLDRNSQLFFLQFLADTDWSGTSKKLSEPDWIDSVLCKTALYSNRNSEEIVRIISAASTNGQISSAINRLYRKPRGRLSGGCNIVFHGAPGTGKSHRIEQFAKSASGSTIIRTVFHADTQAGDFLGSFRPSVTDPAGSTFGYSFQPGPFLLALIHAINHPGSPCFLVIEEINRAPAASVFGELFQLLDRQNDGASRYGIIPSDAALGQYLAAAIPEWTGMITMPSNLFLLASMNSGDQAVFAMDTAFKRRWRFEYIPINLDICPLGNLPLPILQGLWSSVPWKRFASVINEVLEQQGVPEDRLLGPFFLTASELENGPAYETRQDASEAGRASVGKLFLYLWDDVLRHSSKESIFASHIRSLSHLTREFICARVIFNHAVAAKLGRSSDNLR